MCKSNSKISHDIFYYWFYSLEVSMNKYLFSINDKMKHSCVIFQKKIQMKNFLFGSLSILLFLTFSHSSLQWLSNYDEAISRSSSENKPILLVFSGSDWCKPCIRLEQQVFETDTFQAYAKEHLVLLKADFPRKRKNKLSKSQQQHNENLAEKYNKTGQFPFVILLDKNGKILENISTNVSEPRAFLKQILGKPK